MKNKTVIIALVLMFAIALAAGMVAGKLSARLPGSALPVQQGTLSDELQLNADQRAQMQQIWEAVSGKSQQCVDDAKQVQRDQDKALLAMMTDEQKAQYSLLTNQTAGKIAVIEARRKAAFKDAVDKTMGILNPAQRESYRQILKDRDVLPDSANDQISKN